MKYILCNTDINSNSFIYIIVQSKSNFLSNIADSSPHCPSWYPVTWSITSNTRKAITELVHPKASIPLTLKTPFKIVDFCLLFLSLRLKGNLIHLVGSCYSRLSLSRHRLSRITAYLEVKIWSLIFTWKSNNR